MARSSTIFAELSSHPFRTSPEKFVPPPPVVSGQVTKSGQVILPHIKACDATLATVCKRLLWNFQNIKSPSVSVHTSLILDFDDVRSAQFCVLPLPKGNRKETSSLLYASDPPSYLEWRHIRPLLMIQVQISIDDFHKGHLWSLEVINRCLLFRLRATHDWKEMDTWAWVSISSSRHYASIDMQYDRYNWVITFDLRSNVGAIFQGHYAKASLWEENDGEIIMPLAFVVQRLFVKM